MEHIERLEPALTLDLMWLGPQCPELPCDGVLDDAKGRTVYLVHQPTQPPTQPPPLADILLMIAFLGGHLRRKDGSCPGVKVMWIGLRRTRDFVLALQAPQVANRQEKLMCRAEL